MTHDEEPSRRSEDAERGERTQRLEHTSTFRVWRKPSERRVLVIDADAEHARALEQLRLFGYDVTVVPDGAHALEELEREPPGAVVADLASASDASSELAAELRDASRAVPLLAISAHADLGTRLAAVRAGAVCFFAKPVDIGELADRLDVITGRRVPRPFTVLIIDDDVFQLAVYAEILKRAGMNPIVVSDPLTVLDRMAERPPDLILLDVHMPECSGIELVQVIRQSDESAGTPIVFFTADAGAKKELLDLGVAADDFLSKSIESDLLTAAVKTRAARGRLIRALMSRDGLTGLPHHSKVKEFLALELDSALARRSTLAFAMLDVDQFKSVNDTYGHAAGDRALKSIARVLRQRLRGSDIVGRYGGEEFAVILPETDGPGALRALDEAREVIGQVPQVSRAGTFRVTVSGGIAVGPPWREPARLIDAADRALYEAKSSGRNRIVVSREEPSDKVRVKPPGGAS